MKLENVKVYDLEESLIASGYPMRTELLETHAGDKDIKRCLNLTKASNGNGAHGQWMTGVRVAFDLTCTNKMWVEAERYRFLEFVSSQSTMHRITKFKIREQYNQYVDPRVIDIMEEKTFNKTFQGENVYKRVARLEEKAFGKSSEGELSERTDRLKAKLLAVKQDKITYGNNYQPTSIPKQKSYQ